MKILNMDRSRCGIVFDLSDHFPTKRGRYTIVQHIRDCRASYTIYDHKTNTVLHGDTWHDHYALEDTTGHTFRLSGKQIVRTIYDSELCIDNIPDYPGELWYFVGDYFLANVKNSREKYLVSNYARIKTYRGRTAKLMHPPINEHGYREVKFHRKRRERPPVHRLVAYYFCWQRDKPEIPFENLHIHHVKDKLSNEAWNLLALTPKEHMALHAALRKAA